MGSGVTTVKMGNLESFDLVLQLLTTSPKFCRPCLSRVFLGMKIWIYRVTCQRISKLRKVIFFNLFTQPNPIQKAVAKVQKIKKKKHVQERWIQSWRPLLCPKKLTSKVHHPQTSCLYWCFTSMWKRKRFCKKSSNILFLSNQKLALLRLSSLPMREMFLWIIQVFFFREYAVTA